MHPIHDADVLLLLAITLASKCKPATLAEVVVCLARVQPRLPAEARLLEAFEHLSRHGLIVAHEGGYTLCEAAENIMRGVPRRKEIAEQLFCLKDRLAQFDGKPSKPAVQPEAAELAAAIAAWQASLPPLTKTEKFELRRQEAREPAKRSGPPRGKPGFPRSPRKPSGRT
ncbi:hypothetical protein [Niveibacterium terrae]|uniref:hypothetical protein n=1 Tax=Niveibacterium terrae TaxID=3373598 RepID=UPI003A91B5BB